MRDHVPAAIGPPRPALGRVFDDITHTIGATPLVRLNRLPETAGCGADILMKLEFFNPLGSVKDRIALAMVESAEAEGRISPGGTLIEPTSGNTGIALAFVCAARGYRLILTMPSSMSAERRKMLKLLGADLELTPADAGMPGAIARAEELQRTIPGSLILQQFANPANPAIHERATAEEVWRDTGGHLDALVVGVGTGGTLTGVGRALKARRPDLYIIAVEPEDSPVLSGGRPGGHKIQGIGAGFVPDVLDGSSIDEVLCIGNETAFQTARDCARMEGIPIGISSGATLAAAIEFGQRPANAGRRVVAFAASCAERYLSTELFQEG
ncbi:MAG: cysteine synthase A [Pseudomonadota bacterium]